MPHKINAMDINSSDKRTARIAGLWYLGVVITGIFSLMYVPSKLIHWNNAEATFTAIVKNETLFRLGIVGGLLCYTFFIFLPLALYRLLKQVDEGYAKLMVLLALFSVPMFFINAQNLFTVLSLICDDQYFKAFSTEQIQTQVLFYLDQYDSGLLIIHLFSGLWLFPFGYLVYKSSFLPKLFGILLMLGCFGYLTNSVGHTVIKHYSELGIAKYISLPASIGEIGICFWLLIVGVKRKTKRI